VFGRVLGLFRTGATLKSGKLLRLEISAQEMADLLGYAKSTIESALRWLGSGPIDNKGAQLARGLGIIHRGRRTAFGFLDGVFRRVYRTSRLVLTLAGRVLLGLVDRVKERRNEERRKFFQRKKEQNEGRPPTISQRTPEQRLDATGPPDGPPSDMVAESRRQIHVLLGIK